MNSKSIQMLAIATAIIMTSSIVGYLTTQQVQADLNANGGNANGGNANGGAAESTASADGTTRADGGEGGTAGDGGFAGNGGIVVCVTDDRC